MHDTLGQLHLSERNLELQAQREPVLIKMTCGGARGAGLLGMEACSGTMVDGYYDTLVLLYLSVVPGSS